jgi:hypothetical protein
MFLQLSVAEILVFLLQENAESFKTLELFYHMLFCGLQMNFDLQAESSDR